MRVLLAALSILTLASPAFAEDAPAAPAAAPAKEEPAPAATASTERPDISDWFQEQRKATVARSLKDEERYKDGWVKHVKDYYNVDIKKPDNTPTPYNPEATADGKAPAMANFTEGTVDTVVDTTDPADESASAATDASAEETPAPAPKWSSEAAADAAAGVAQPLRTEGWSHEVAPQ